MIVLCETQGTPEWHAARAGCITASRINDAKAAPNTKRYRNYIAELVLDLEGVPNHWEEQTPKWFEAGKRFEPEARRWIEYHKDIEVEQTGFVVHDEHHFIGCSPDGIIRDLRTGLKPDTTDALVEIKYRHSLKLLEHHAARVVAETYNQMQFQMLVTGLELCLYANYWCAPEHGLEELKYNWVVRDRARQEYLFEKALMAYKDATDQYRQRKNTPRQR